MLDIGRPSGKTDVSRLSDAELVAQLADQAKALGRLWHARKSREG
jgi:hypothetical protein